MRGIRLFLLASAFTLLTPHMAEAQRGKKKPVQQSLFADLDDALDRRPEIWKLVQW